MRAMQRQDENNQPQKFVFGLKNKKKKKRKEKKERKARIRPHPRHPGAAILAK